MGICIGCIEEKRLKKFKYNDVKPFLPKITRALCVKVYDGDTITIIARGSNTKEYARYRVRLARIDAPELATGNNKALAISSRDLLSHRILGEVVTLRDIKTEKWGRLLAEVEHNGLNMSDFLVDNNMAVPYDGGKKQVNFDHLHVYSEVEK